VPCAPPAAKHISAARTSDDQARLIASKVRGQHQITVIRSGLLGQVDTMLAWFIARGASRYLIHQLLSHDQAASPCGGAVPV